jgi:trans-2,3-dihydro-3-hydroxyanthranilate isomerase
VATEKIDFKRQADRRGEDLVVCSDQGHAGIAGAGRGKGAGRIRQTPGFLASDRGSRSGRGTVPRYAYQTVDVFTGTRFGGSPLAVLLDARGLDDLVMLQVTREFNYSETTFVLPPEDPANTARVRIFTPTGEVPFAGHPNVGTGYVLARQGDVFGRPVGETLRFEEGAGLVIVEPAIADGRVTGGRITAPQPPTIGREFDPAAVARCVGLQPEHIVTTNHHPVRASVGLPFTMVEIDSRDALARAIPDARETASLDWRSGADACGEPFAPGFYVYARDAHDPSRIAARMFSPLENPAEDPATGSAAGALAGLLAHLSGERDGRLAWSITQGVDMGRPSTIEVAATIVDGAVSVTISGMCIPVMTGEIEV